MMDVNSGYIGYSMSRRAAEAYEDGDKLFDKNVGADSPTRRDER